jgi:NAD(P)-dependent dehydrogenase (short-subunit alcohol dehydrogenase family)
VVRFSGRIAFITGAASGIGLATSARLAAEGAKIVALDTQQAALDALSRELGDAVLACAADIFSAADREAALRRGREKFGNEPDILVNCVGGSTILPKPDMALAEMSEEQWDAMLAFNLKGAFLCCRDLIPIMRKQKRGAIVNLTSFTGRGMMADAGVAYATAKAGLVGFTRRLAVELAPEGIRCNAVAPGFVMTDRIRRHIWEAVGPEGQQRLRARIPMGRFAEPAEIAATVSFLASDDAAYMTGAILDCNGGVL